ncbi:molybdopterin-dependent oxidoreductase [Microlunatus speluncae]|uniref:molybdopterin-dependent oxidoreductase n=1 Tax=Microlunatus speluncae TaxID=2594267 RepID=UPI0015820C6D|nr:molybdopterin-dependent oxidoreductase [Microlunatus speluncae]
MIIRLRPPNEQDFRSPLRSERLTSILGIALGLAFTICFLTGLISHLIQHPPGWFAWPTGPSWLYRVTQGLHVTTGMAAIPLLAVKLWSVAPKFWRRFPTGRARAMIIEAVERGTILLLIGAAFFEVLTGLLNVAEAYLWPFFFPEVHYLMAWLLIGSVVLHVAVRLPIMISALRRRDRRPPPPPAEPRAPGAETTITRRHLLTGTAIAAAVIAIATLGDKIPALRGVSVLAQRSGTGPQGLPVNRTAAAAGIRADQVGADYRLALVGTRTVELSLADLTALPQRTVELPIACVEGWSQLATWTGVRLSDLIGLVDDHDFTEARLASFDAGPYGRSVVASALARHPETLIALRLNGEVLDHDHGFPARLIAPNRPGALQTKWLSRIEIVR